MTIQEVINNTTGSLITFDVGLIILMRDLKFIAEPGPWQAR